MIEEEILSIIEDKADNGERLNDLIDQFRRGRSVTEIIGLLDSSRTDLVWIGALILGELSLDRYNSDLFLVRLRKLINHTDAQVRFHAFGALFSALSPEEADTQTLLRKLLNDPNPGVRKRAEAAAARLSLT
jgi:hypothetical protein